MPTQQQGRRPRRRVGVGRRNAGVQVLAVRGPVAPVPARRARRNRARNMNRMMSGLTHDGMCFLKCATAQPDFDNTGSKGVPDYYSGRSLTKLHAMNTSVTFPAGQDTYIIVPPVPGIGYWILSGVSGPGIVGQFVATPFSDYVSMFTPTSFLTGAIGTSSSTLNVDSFRVISLAAELQPTVNEMNWAGTIAVAKFPLRLSQVLGTASGATTASTGDNALITGIAALEYALINGFAGQLYTAPFNQGMYTASFNRQSTFEFKDVGGTIVTNNTAPFPGPQQPTITSDSSLVTFGLPIISTSATSNIGLWTGMDDLDSIILRVSVPSGGPSMTGIIKTWQCTEYVPNPGSAMYEFSGEAAQYDPLALQAYKRIACQLPVAVSYYDNDNFWDRVAKLIEGVTDMTSFIPGPIGLGSIAVNQLTKALRRTTI
jgi:hypothetical protein